MTSSQLLGIFGGHYKLQGTEIDISPDEVYLAGQLAQMDILQEVRPLDRKGAITLVADQEEYSYSAVTITGATVASPSVITATAHPFNTGDYVTIANVLGTTTVNGRWKVTKITANTFSLDGSTGVGVYTSGGTAYHDLMSAFRLKHLFRLESPYGQVEIKSPIESEFYRDYFEPQPNASPAVEDVVECYQVMEEYLKLVFQGMPSTTVKLGMIYVRIPLPSETVSSTVNPIVPHQYDSILSYGTIYYVLRNHQVEAARAEADKMYPRWMRELEKGKRLNGSRRYIHEEDPRGLKWNS